MAKPVSYTKAQDDDNVVLEMVEPSFNAKDDGGGEPMGLYFERNRSKKKIDYVLVYERCEEKEDKDEDSRAKAEKLEEMRKAFEASLDESGLLIERVERQCSKDSNVKRHFVLLHAPWPVLAKKAEAMRLKVAFQENDIVFKSWVEKRLGDERMQSLRRRNPLVVQDPTFEEKGNYFMANFKEESLTKFLNYQNRDELFDDVDRIYIVQQICYNARFAEGSHGVGLRKMIYEGAYLAGYPLHAGPDTVEADEQPSNDRQRLKRDWARFGRWMKFQPYGEIKNYFGSEIALYFAWLGFYTAMLVPLAIIGFIVFIYGIGSAGSHPPVEDVCDSANKGKWIMCPLCDRQCSYWDLASSTCLYAYVTHFFDNDWTVGLALIASVWATLFLEFWKRRQATLAQEWHTDDFEEEEEPLRPEYSATVTTLRRNEVTGKLEPYVPKIQIYSRLTGVFSIIIFMIFLVIAAVVGVIVYRAAVFASLSGNKDRNIQTRARIITSATAALLNLVAINLLKFAYSKLAVWLTDWENPPTRTDYEDSFTWKMYLFQFVNTYASIFYIAFFKSGIVVGTPSRYKRIANSYRLDSCSEQGCFLELCVQLLIIMVGQQVIGNITEVAIPSIMFWLKSRKEQTKDLPQYQRDFDLSPQGDHSMFWEYLEVVLQYGFVTMFVAAFPLGPLFALLNSVVEIRVDAINFVSQFRRPDCARAEDIGAWFRILEGVTRISVLVNAFVLAFTSEYIPKLIYRTRYAPDRDEPGGGTLAGYIDNSLSTISTAYIYNKEPETDPINPLSNLEKLNLNLTLANTTICRYSGHFDSFAPYKQNKQYWHVIAARLAFVFVFQFTVYLITGFIGWLVPDVPRNLELKSKRENHLIKQAFNKKGYSDNDDYNHAQNEML